MTAQTADRYIFPSDPDRMDRATAEVEARRYALWCGGAEAALSGRYVTHSSEFDWALRRLSQLERGVSIAELEPIVAVARGEAVAFWGGKLEAAKASQAAWLRDLSVAKASQFVSAVAA